MVEVVGEAYDIAAYYLAMSGTIPRDGQIHDRLLQIVYRLFGSGIRNRLLLANKAIAAFERHGGARSAVSRRVTPGEHFTNILQERPCENVTRIPIDRDRVPRLLDPATRNGSDAWSSQVRPCALRRRRRITAKACGT